MFEFGAVDFAGPVGNGGDSPQGLRLKILLGGDSDGYPTRALGGGGAMALSMDEERMLAEIERRLADDDPMLAARLTTFRLPRLTLATRSARSRLMTSVLMLVVVGVVAVFVYALVPFRGQQARLGG